MIDLFGIKPLLKLLRLRKPGMVFLLLVNNKENDMLKFVLVLPPAGAHDVVNREVSIQVGDKAPSTFDIPVSDNETKPFEGKEGDEIKGSLIDVDDAGNRSEPRDFGFILRDTLAPPKPGELGLRVTEESPDEEPPVEPPAPPTDEEPEEPTV